MSSSQKTYILLSVLLILTGTRLLSQTFPVVSTTQIIPPYSVYLSDYASASSDKLIANLFLQDQNQNGLQVKLKITILGENGVKLETKPEFMPPPITLYSGVPEPVSGTALQAYLEPANLNITGLNLQEFMQSKKLPEGIYQFTVEAVEYRRNKLVSDPGTAVGWLILNDPPLWNLPRHNSVVTAGNPQNVFFSWFPMHKGSPNSAFTVEYEFSLYDPIPQNTDPDNFVNTAVPMWQSTTMSTVLSYGPAEPPLEPGRKYACRLRAYDTEGRDLFRNNGYSTVLVFTYGQECITPVGIYHDNLTPHTADIHWTAVPGNTEFTVYYREKDENATNPWYEASTTQRDITIPQLKPLHTYQYTLKGVCGTLESEPAEIYEFTTTQKTVDTLSCNGSGDVPVIDGSPPLDELLLGDVINVGGFEGIITQARGGNGVFTGKCIMRLSNFNILLKSHFTDIHINQSYQVTQGNVIADRGPGIMINLDEIIAEIDSLANLTIDSIIDNPDDYLEDLEIVYDLDPVLVTDSLAEDLEEIQSDLEELSGTDGLTEEQLDEIQELLEQIENLLNGGNQSGDNRSFVMFKPFHGQYYGFDEPDTVASLQQYYLPPNQIGGKNQLIRWKSMKVNGNPDKVIARLDSVNPNIKFYNSAGTELMAENGPADTLKIVTIPSPTMVSDDIITAVWQENDTVKHVVGMLNVKAYEEKNLNIVVVPVNGNVMPMTIDQLRDSLNKTFGEAAINLNVVEYEDNFMFNYKQADGDEHFNAWPDSNEVATADMLALQEAFVQTGNYDENTYYLFLVRNSSHWELLGLMPFFQNFGYIFTDGVTVEQCTHTSLHELGHGAFGLVHPFDQHAGIDEYNYPNLMTYHYSSTKLLKYQWDLIQNPVCWIGLNCYGARNAGMIMKFESNYHLAGLTVEYEGVDYKGDIPIPEFLGVDFKLKIKDNTGAIIIDWNYYEILSNGAEITIPWLVFKDKREKQNLRIKYQNKDYNIVIKKVYFSFKEHISNNIYGYEDFKNNNTSLDECHISTREGIFTTSIGVKCKNCDDLNLFVPYSSNTDLHFTLFDGSDIFNGISLRSDNIDVNGSVVNIVREGTLSPSYGYFYVHTFKYEKIKSKMFVVNYPSFPLTTGGISDFNLFASALYKPLVTDFELQQIIPSNSSLDLNGSSFIECFMGFEVHDPENYELYNANSSIGAIETDIIVLNEDIRKAWSNTDAISQGSLIFPIKNPLGIYPNSKYEIWSPLGTKEETIEVSMIGSITTSRLYITRSSNFLYPYVPNDICELVFDITLNNPDLIKSNEIEFIPLLQKKNNLDYLRTYTNDDFIIKYELYDGNGNLSEIIHPLKSIVQNVKWSIERTEPSNTYISPHLRIKIKFHLKESIKNPPQYIDIMSTNPQQFYGCESNCQIRNVTNNSQFENITITNFNPSMNTITGIMTKEGVKNNYTYDPNPNNNNLNFYIVKKDFEKIGGLSSGIGRPAILRVKDLLDINHKNLAYMTCHEFGHRYGLRDVNKPDYNVMHYGLTDKIVSSESQTMNAKEFHFQIKAMNTVKTGTNEEDGKDQIQWIIFNNNK